MTDQNTTPKKKVRRHYVTFVDGKTRHLDDPANVTTSDGWVVYDMPNGDRLRIRAGAILYMEEMDLTTKQAALKRDSITADPLPQA